jgi:NOL1/NOP2/fmu family ribosome biogenesis protein
MFLDHVIRSTIGDVRSFRVLDLCAAPGGKSTLLNSLIGEEGLLVSNELIRNRVPALATNLGKWGTANSVVTNNEPSHLGKLEGYFDLLVVDAPCSGSGLFRKQPDAIEEWSEKNVLMCCQRQKNILLEALPALKEGGWLFYSTCSFSVEENEVIVQWLTNEQDCEYVPVPVDPAWGVVTTESGYRFYPDKTESEGFFCALLRRKGEAGNTAVKGRKGLQAPPAADRAILAPYLSAGKEQLVSLHGRPHLVGSAVAGFIEDLASSLYVKKAGQYLGEIKGKDLVPSQDMAWSLFLDGRIARLELDKESALAYLRKSNFQFPHDLRGLHLITHQGFGLGWGKFMPGRMNNNLPNELRILM